MKAKKSCGIEIATMVFLVALIGLVAWYLAAPFALGFVATASGSMVAGKVVAVAASAAPLDPAEEKRSHERAAVLTS